jgi:hypothetical protein
MCDFNYNKHLLNTYFKLPIECINDKHNLNETIKLDLELINNESQSELEKKQNNLCMYDYIFNPTNVVSKQILKNWANHYTTNTQFLKDSQKLYLNNEFNVNIGDNELENICHTWNQIKYRIDFIDHYNYVDWKPITFLNNSPLFLNCLNISGLVSPIMFFVIPILSLIVPFFLLKLFGYSIGFMQYMTFAIKVFSNHSFFRIINFFNQNLSQQAYTIFTTSIFITQIYQQIHSCYTYHCNIKSAHENMILMRGFVKQSIESTQNFLNIISNLETYSPFSALLSHHLMIFEKHLRHLNTITPYQLRYSKVVDLGNAMYSLYTFHEDKEFEKSMNFMIGFFGYLQNISNLKKHINSKNICKCTFDETKNDFFENIFYPPHILQNHKSNYICLSKNKIITGPNASGKTTILKSTLINIIFSQQLGLGLYSDANIKPYDHIHCYLNIPDTSGRDSLFQAEARRCKEILDDVELYKDERHFCMFDELYSGTNPYEAISSAFAFLSHLDKNKNITYMVTTHYLELCKLLKKHESNYVTNNSMKVIKNEDDTFVYTYELSNGVSNIKGGVKVLLDLDYPTHIVDLTKKIVKKLSKI